MYRRFILIFFIIIMIPVLISAGQIETTILQTKLNRIYFPVGTESLVFEGSRFVVSNQTDTLLVGEIEKLYDGVSISKEYDSLIELDNSVIVNIETLDEDSTSRIEIGMVEFLSEEFVLSENISDNGEVTILIRNSNNISSQFIYAYSTDKDKYDIIVSYKSCDLENEIKLPAQFISVIVPDLTKSSFTDILSTALYYYFSPDISPFFFNGDDVSSIDCLFPSDSLCSRSYLHEPIKGNKLLKTFNNPDIIKIGYDNFYLENCAIFFADILNREKIPAEVFSGYAEPTLSIRFIPFLEHDRSAGLIKIIELLKTNLPEKNNYKETLAIIEEHLKSADDTEDPVMKEYFYKLVDYSLKYDLGVFPLFRPTVFIYKSDLISPLEFDENGKIDLDKIKKYKYPERLEN